MKLTDQKIIIFLPCENVCGTVENRTSLYKTHSKVPANPCIVVDSFNVNDAWQNRELSIISAGRRLGWWNWKKKKKKKEKKKEKEEKIEKGDKNNRIREIR